MDASMIVALTGVLTAVTGIWLTERGRRDQNRQQVVAEKALEGKGELDRTQQLLDGLQAAVERADAREQQLLDRNDRKDQRIEQLEDEADKTDRRHRQELDDQEARFREERAAFTEQLLALRSIVNDQIARAAGATVLDRPLPHPDNPHPTPEDAEL